MIKTINLSLPADLLTTINDAALRLYASRSEYIRHAIIEQLRVDAGANERRPNTKRLPRKLIVHSETEEFGIAPEYFED